MADFRLGRIKFKWQGAWASGTEYVKDDVVRVNNNSYVCVLNHTAGVWATDLAANKWDLMVAGDASPTTTDGDMIYRDGGSDQRLAIGAPGQALIVDDNGLPSWQGLTTAQSIYYVKADGNDANDGTNLNQAFRTIRHACDTVTGPATIYVKGGLYYERLPLVVPANVTIVGDGQRTTGVAPINITNNTANILPTTGSQTSTTIIIDTGSDVGNTWQVGDTIDISSITNGGSGIVGTVTITNVQISTPSSPFTTLTVSFNNQTVTATDCTISSDYSEDTMWLLNDGSTLNKMYFKDMGGWEPDLSYPEDPTQAATKGVFVALDPNNPIVNKSPYVLECAAFSDLGAIGAMVDGDVHASGIKSMVFHGYTVVCSDGIGYWVNGQGKAEIVSCFTYYCWIGYTTTGGGKIRALNGNNSYGTYGVISRGFDAIESPVTGSLYGEMITWDPLTLLGAFQVGETVTGGTSGAVGTITNIQSASDKFYYISGGGTFQVGETVTGSTSGATATIDTGGVSGQKGYVLVADGFAEEPRPGGSISLAGDNTTYIIQSVSGTYTNSSSVLIIVLAGEKADPSADNTSVAIRYQYSNARLTGHDFLSVGTGDKTTTNYPGEPTQPAAQGNEVIESYPGRVFYVSTDQDGNFRVGDYFRVDQATGKATLNASAFDLSGLSSLKLGAIGAQLGEQINEFSSDSTMSGNSNTAVPTEAAVRAYFEQIATDVVIRDPGVLYRGTDAPATATADGLTGLMGLAINDADEFSQFAIKNVNAGNNASTDFIAYADNGDNNSGWIDMGITGSTFNDPLYGVTGINDGYIFMSASSGSVTGNGNLYISTSGNGAQNDIVFSTGGFEDSSYERMRIVGVAHDGFNAGINLVDDVSTTSGRFYVGPGAKTLTINGTISSTTLTAGINDSVTTIPVASTTGFNSYGVITIGSEDIQYTGKGSTSFTGCTRGTNGTTAASHSGSDAVTQNTYVGLTGTTAVFTGDADDFVQFAIKNTNSGTSASTDLIAYASDGDNDSGWIDLGITSGNYSDPGFTVTGPGTGYLFFSAPAGTPGTGDLLIGTDETGSNNDIVFFTGGFDAGNERLRITGEGAAAGVSIYSATDSTSTTTGALRVTGGIGLQGNLNVGGNVSIVGTISIGGAGSSLSTTTLAVSDPMIKMGKGNAADITDLGFYGIYSSVSSTLNGAIDASVTSITLASAASFPSSGNAFIDDEEITWSGKSTNTLTGVTRGANGTTAVSHLTGATVFIAKYAGLVRDASDNTYKLFRTLDGLSPTSTVNFASGTLEYAPMKSGAFESTGAVTSVGVTSTGTIAANASGGITTNQATFPLVNTTATTVNFAGAATAINMGANTGTATINNVTISHPNATSMTMNGASPSITTTSTGTASVFNTNALTGNLFGAATTVNVGKPSDSSSVTNVYNKFAIKGYTSGAVTFQAPAAAGSVTYTLPSTDGTNGYALVTNGSGTLSWAVAGATITDDTSTTTLYPAMSASSTGNFTSARVTSTKFTFNASSGLLTVTSLTESSSIALKENVNPITGALDTIMQLCGVTYDRKDGSKKNEAGLIAEDVVEVLPNLITFDEDNRPSGINYTKLSAYLIEAVKTLKAEIDELKGNK